MLSPRFQALAVHLLTATGAVFSMLAMLAAVDERWGLMFFWLIVALVVDGVDGPLARRFNTKKNWPTHDGILMDLIVDYLTYVFIPAYALFKSGLLPGWTGWLAIIAIVYGSVIYFADTRMKTRDNSFSGFPACWNMVVLVLFTIKPNFYLTLVIVVALAVAMFLNLRFIHPMRTERWRAISMPMTAAWVVFALWAMLDGFHPDSWARWGLVIASAWLLLAGIAQQLIPPRRA